MASYDVASTPISPYLLLRLLLLQVRVGLRPARGGGLASRLPRHLVRRSGSGGGSGGGGRRVGSEVGGHGKAHARGSSDPVP